MYKPEQPKPMKPTSKPASAWERIETREKALEARIETLETQVALLLERVAKLENNPTNWPSSLF